MSENEYLLPLTERERELVMGLSLCRFGALALVDAECRGDDVVIGMMNEYQALHDKLRALEPIGTGGTTEGA